MAESMSTAETVNRAVAADRIANRIEATADAVRLRADMAHWYTGVPVNQARISIALQFAQSGSDTWWAEMNGGRSPSERTKCLVVELLASRFNHLDDDPFAGLQR